MKDYKNVVFFSHIYSNDNVSFPFNREIANENYEKNFIYLFEQVFSKVFLINYPFIANNKNISYKGILPYNNTNSFLKTYHALIFPTYYPGEGFAGCLIDAFSSGLPVLASNWMGNSEIIKDGINGLLFEPKSVNSLVQAIKKFEMDEKKYFEYKLANLALIKKYNSKEVLNPFFDEIDKSFIQGEKK